MVLTLEEAEFSKCKGGSFEMETHIFIIPTNPIYSGSNNYLIPC